MRTSELFSNPLYVVAEVLLVIAAATSPTPTSAADPRAMWCGFAVSPDGTRIVYPAPDYDQNGDSATAIWIASIDGSGARRLGLVTGYCDATWSGGAAAAAVDTTSSRITFFPASGGSSRVVSIPDTYGPIFSMNVSPDGSRIAFGAYVSEQKKAGVFLMETDGGKITELLSETVKSPIAWSADSKRVAFGVGDYQAKYDLKIIDIASGEATDTGINGVGVAFSPDGKSIAYTGNPVRGGSWFGGIPCDGRLMRTDLVTKETIPLSESAVNTYDEDSKRWELSGSLAPCWSPDGTKIAYHRRHSIREDRETKLDQQELWVVNSDGTVRSKLMDRASRFAWSSDSKSVLVKTEDAIQKIALPSGQAAVVVKLPSPPPPDAIKQATGETKAPGASVSYAGIDRAYATAIAKLASEARSIYAGKFGFSMPEEIAIEVKKDSNARTNLWNDGDSHVFLTLRSAADLAPPAKSGYFNIYGICHELGHIAMYRNIINLGLPPGVAEGWPHYAGSVVVDEVWSKLWRDLWPEPYDYLADGTARLEKQSSDPGAAKSPMNRVAITLYKLGKSHGTDKVMASMNAAFAGKPYGKDVMNRFVNDLVKRTGDQSVAASLPSEMLTPSVEWKVAERDISDKAAEGMIQEKDDTGMLLRYDDGTSDGKRSTAGAGHAVVFKAPAGSWAVDGVRIYGSRYGEEQPPKEDFSIFICDKDFEVIKKIDRPYSDLGAYDEGWRKIDFAPVKVPGSFYVCIYFNPTATKGFYMNYDKSVAKSHSKAALPWTFVYDLEGTYDWMIRPHLVAD